MNKNTQGTIVLDGMIEGRLPSDAKAAETVRHWVEFSKSVNLHFNFEADGGSFNILADNRPVDVSAIGPDPVEVVSSALGELLKAFAPGERSGLFSTLRGGSADGVCDQAGRAGAGEAEDGGVGDNGAPNGDQRSRSISRWSVRSYCGRAGVRDIRVLR